MNNKNVIEKMEELKKGLDSEVLDLFDSGVDYNGCYYICDMINEVADSFVDIYNSDLLDWAKNNYKYIEEALGEFGTPTDSNGNADFFKIINQGEYLYYNNLFYDNLDNFIKYYILKYLIDNNIIIDDDNLNRLLDINSNDIDNNNYLEDIDSYVEEFLKDKEVI